MPDAPRTKESGPEPYEPHTWSVSIPPDDYIGQLEAERDALREALKKLEDECQSAFGEPDSYDTFDVARAQARVALERPE